MPTRRREKLKLKIKPLELLPEKATVTPKFLKSFVASRSRTPTGSETKVQVPLASDKVPRLPKLLRGRRSRTFADKMRPLPKFSHYPHLVRLARGLKSLLLKVEPDKPVRMPRFPTLAFPPLYTRYPIMKTYTAVTDSEGKVFVSFPRVFRKIPGVILTPQSDVTWFPIVLSKNEFGFTARILKTIHNHQHASSGGGGQHSHGGGSGWGGYHSHDIGTGGAHWHSVSGYLTLVLYRALALVSAQVGGETNHKHSNPDTGAPSSSKQVMSSAFSWGSDCAIGSCISAFNFTTVAASHHTHAQGSTGGSTGHTHDLSVGSSNFLHDADISIGAWTSDTHTGHSDHPASDDGYHDHVIIFEANHEHTVPDSNEKEATALPNTSVTFTYFAQEETT